MARRIIGTVTTVVSMTPILLTAMQEVGEGYELYGTYPLDLDPCGIPAEGGAYLNVVRVPYEYHSSRVYKDFEPFGVLSVQVATYTWEVTE